MEALLFLLAISFSFGYPVKCHTYEESNKTYNNVCARTHEYGVFENEGNYYLNLCKSGQYCDMTGDKYTKVCVPDVRYPGEYCAKNANCYTNKCAKKTKRCKGKSISEQCNNHADCDVGLFCKVNIINHTSSMTCQPVLKEGEDCTSYTYQCGVNSVCNDGICTKAGSLENGEPATNSMACKSNFIMFGKCDEGFKLVRNYYTKQPSVCKEECNYINSRNEALVKDCVCGMNQINISFCQVLEGDFDFTIVSLLITISYGIISIVYPMKKIMYHVVINVL